MYNKFGLGEYLGGKRIRDIEVPTFLLTAYLMNNCI